MNGFQLIAELMDSDPMSEVYIDVGGASGPYLRVIAVNHYPSGVKGKPSLILQASDADTMDAQKRLLVSTLQTPIARAKAALQSLIAIEESEDVQLNLIRPRKPAKVIELNPEKKK